MITQKLLDESYTYATYSKLIDTLLAEGKTTGDNHSEDMIAYTKMNVHRMKRLEKKPELNEKLRQRLQKVEKPQTWLVIGEAWCGDVAQNLPTIQKMADASEAISLKIVLRDEHPDLIKKYAYNGTLSIPRIIALTDELEELWVWGPRPKECQDLMMELKTRDDLDVWKKAELVHKWYAKDKTKTLQKEFYDLLETVIAH